MTYVRKRVKQPSTWLGVITALTPLLTVATGGAINPAIISAIAAGAALIHIDESPDIPAQPPATKTKRKAS